MKSYYISQFKNSMFLSIGLLFFVACGSYKNTSYYDSDGVYGSAEKPIQKKERVYIQEIKVEDNKYAQQFKSMQIYSDDEQYLTDVDAYATDSVRVDTVYIERKQYASWGDNSTDDVTINVYNNGWGYNDWWYQSYWNTWYRPRFSWNMNIGWSYNYYGPSWGWGWNSPYYWDYPYYGGYYNPYYYGNAYYGGYYYGRNNVAYNNGVRGGNRSSNIYGSGSRTSYSQSGRATTYENPRGTSTNPRSTITTPRSVTNPRGFENPRGTTIVTPKSETPRSETPRGFDNPRGSSTVTPKSETPRNDTPRVQPVTPTRSNETPRSTTPTRSNDTPTRSYESPRSSSSSPSYTPSRSYDSPRSSSSSSSSSPSSGSSGGGRGGRR